jgi:hypothetical protein
MNSKINDLFVPYEISVLLFEKNFDEKCIAVYYYDNGEIKINRLNDNATIKNSEVLIESLDNCYPAPLYTQVFEWFVNNPNVYFNANIPVGKEIQNNIITNLLKQI